MPLDVFRSLLFVPGTRPERFAKALAAGADAVCIDLEDAVPPDGKAAARETVRAFVASQPDQGSVALGVRINALETIDGAEDAAMWRAAGRRPDFVMVPKALNADALVALQREIGVPVWAVVESVAGLHAASDIARAVSPGGGILFGGADFSAEIGTGMDWEALAYARGRLAVDARIAPLSLMDVPWLAVDDEAGLRAEAERVRGLGFDGKACIHPAQVSTVNAVFSPSDAETAWARRVVDADRAAGGHALLLDGKLVDAPVVARARRVLARAGG